MTVTEPGLYPDIDFAEYLADPVSGGSLSHSGIKTLVNLRAERGPWGAGPAQKAHAICA